MNNSELVVKVTAINNKWHVRIIKNDVILDEMACAKKEDIGWICREMMRWIDKLGFNSDEFTAASRKRKNSDNSSPSGKVWYKNQLNK